MPAGDQVSLSHLASITRIVEADGESALHKSVHQVLVRMLETSILAHPRISRLIDVWEGIAGTANERIAGHLHQILNHEPDEKLVRHVFRCVSSTAALRGRQTGNHSHFFDDVIDRIVRSRKDGDKSLRCECCGYQFRNRDVKTERYTKIVESGFELERSLFPGRSGDPYKPIDRGNGMTWTQLTIDHVIPEETLGWSDPDNLEVLCMFCNLGKLAYRRPLEGLSSFAVGALAEVPSNRKWGQLKHQVVVAALSALGGTCSQCAKTKSDVELTVRPLLPKDGSINGFLPWNLKSVCYICLANEGDELPQLPSAEGLEDTIGVSSLESTLGHDTE
ncbi:HNH endonuclease [Pseudochrobactrum lubricantis]|uniref:HNH endonuclease n=1 Tax=Pseudochrobactrum lubricantis TaxID=558172 RepID=UPI0035DDA3FE